MTDFELIQGDLFTAETDAIAHGCNTRGKMGAGIAGIFRQKFPLMFDYYKALCDERLFSIGSVLAWVEKGTDGLPLAGCPDLLDYPFQCVYNLGTQVQGGANASPYAVRLSFDHMADRMWKNRHETVAIPLIGCGIGGLSWATDVKPLVERLAQRVEVKVYYLDKKDLN